MSVTKSRISCLLDKGSKVIVSFVSLVVHEYLVLPFTKIIHSLHALALIHEYRKAKLSSILFLIQVSASKIDSPSLKGISKVLKLLFFLFLPLKIFNNAIF